jgi:hypothetical protein
MLDMLVDLPLLRYIVEEISTLVRSQLSLPSHYSNSNISRPELVSISQYSHSLVFYLAYIFHRSEVTTLPDHIRDR